MSRPTPTEALDARWRLLAERALRGAPFDALVARTYDGVAIAPLYPPAPEGGERPLRARAGPWRVVARLDHPDIDAACAQAGADLSEGADAISLVFAASPCAFGFGLADASRAAAARFYGGLAPPPGRGLELDCPLLEPDAAARFVEAWSEASVASTWERLSFAFDPAGADPAAVAAAFLGRDERIESWFCADGRGLHAAGASEAQELAFVLAGGTRALRGLEAAGASLAEARTRLTFRLAADADFFLTIAKLRALRLLWARVEGACGLAPSPVRLGAETAWRMMTRRDPWTNVLRAGAAAAAAALGGADEIAVLPFTQALGLPDPAARRLARTTQFVFMHEAHLAKVADPAGGAGAFEALTQELCASAWRLFQEIERAGGLARAPAQDLLRDEVGRALAERREDACRRLATIVGVSDYPDLAERPVATLAPPAASLATYLGLPLVRLAEPFERLRDQSDARLAATGARPHVLLLGIGTPAGSGESLAFARRLFAAGGFEVFAQDGFADAEAVAAACVASAAQIVCLCPGADVSDELALSSARALAAASERLIYLSGRPSAVGSALRQAGVADFAYPGCDALTILERAQADAA